MLAVSNGPKYDASYIRDGQDMVEALRSGLLKVPTEQVTLDKQDNIHRQLTRPVDAMKYTASHTAKHFHTNDDYIRGLMGPYGSGKSVMCVMEFYYRAIKQMPVRGNWRLSRGLAIRNTAQELEDTTVQTLLDWMPDGKLGTFYKSRQKMVFELGKDRQGNPLIPHPSGDGTYVSCRIMFRAIDRPEQQRKLLSLEFTYGWVNEFREIPFSVVTALSGRIGRFPGKEKTTWSGLWMDTNPFAEDSEYDRLFSGKVPDEIKEAAEKEGLPVPKVTLFEQPSGMSGKAENLKNLPKGKGYYINMMNTAKLEGRDENWVNVHVHGKRGSLMTGKPIWGKAFNRELHVGEELFCYKDQVIGVGVDFGRTPAALFGQKMANGQWNILDEIVMDDADAAQLAYEIKMKCAERGWNLKQLDIVGDPAGAQRSQTDSRSAFDILRANGLVARPARFQQLRIRLDSVRAALQNNTADGKPRMVVDKNRCPQWVMALSGRYQYKKLQTKDEQYSPQPHKNKYSHIADAGQYLVSHYDGMLLQSNTDVEMPTMRGRGARRKVHIAKTHKPW